MRSVLFLLICAALPAAADPGLPVVRPPHLERLDPLVVELIEERAAAAAAHPGDAAAHGELALVYEANTLWSEARAAYENAVRLAPDDLLWRFHLALARRELGDFAGALELHRALAAEHPDFAPVQQRLGEALVEAGELAPAGAAFERLIALEPQSPHGYVGRGDALLRQGDAAKAAEALERAVALAPGYRAAHYLLGTAYRRLGRLGDAERELTRGVDGVLEYLPDPLTRRVQQYATNLTARLSQAGNLLAAGEAARAAALLEEVRAAHPENVTVLNNLAIAYLRSNRLDEAHALLGEARKLDETQFSTYLNLASWALRAGQPAAALEHAEAAVALAPELAQPHYTRAQALAELGRFEDALDSLRQSLEKDAGNPAAETFSGDLLTRLRRFDAAQAHYRAALEIAPGFLPAWLGLAQASVAAGDPAEARRALAEVRRIAPRHPLIGRLERELRERP